MTGALWPLVFGWLAAACALGPAAPTGASPLRIEVDLGPSATVRALYLGEAPEGLTYRMAVLREGAAGRSESNQSGAVGASDTLAVSRVNVAAGDRLSVRLSLSDGAGVLDSARWSRTVDL